MQIMLTRRNLLKAVSSGSALAFLNAGDHCAHADVTAMNLATGRYGAAAATVEDAIYVIGGSTVKSMLGDVEVLRPASNSVKTMEAKLIARRFHAAAAAAAKIYIAGGETDNGLTDTVECLDVKTGRVSTVAKLPTPRRGLAMVANNGFLFVIGGSANTKSVGAVEVYDIARNTWQKAPPLPTPRECTAAIKNGRIYVPGGYHETVPVDVMDVYWIEQARWIVGARLPQPLSAHHVAVVGNTMVSCGDYSKKDTVLAYDFASGLWRQLPPCRPTRHAGVAALNGRVYVIGGNTDGRGSALDTVQVI